MDTSVRRQGLAGMWLIAPLTVLLFTLGGYTASGVRGAAVGAVTGIVWSGVLALIAWAVRRTTRLLSALATIALVAAGAVLFFTLGAGTLEYMLISKASSTTPEWLATITKGPLAEQDILFFIIFNSLLEAVLVPLAVLLNWHNPRRRRTVLVAALIFYAIRVWTYFYFAPEYFDYADITSTQQLVDTLRTRLTLDYGRIALSVVAAALFFRAAVLPARPNTRGPHAAPPPGGGAASGYRSRTEQARRLETQLARRQGAAPTRDAVNRGRSR